MKHIDFQVGSIVKVKDKTEDPDFGTDIGGWQGKVTEIDGTVVCLELDSKTLSSCPDDHIKKCEEDGLEWERIYLLLEDIELAEQRDNELDLYRIRKKIYLKHQWDYLGEKIRKHIQKAFEEVDAKDESNVMEVWGKYLKKELSFPFDAEISQYQDNGPLNQCDKIRIHGIDMIDDFYGVIVTLRRSRNVFQLPLCDLEPIDSNSYNYELVKSYNGWFSNR